MERVLLLRLQSAGCMAEAVLNGIPLGRTPAGGGQLQLPVHEFTMSGDNRIELVIEPQPLVPGFEQMPPRAAIGDGRSHASLHLLLPRVGSAVDEGEARTVAHLEWVSPETQIVELPLVIAKTAHLPVNFPRWRWLDAPRIDNVEALRPQVVAYLQGIALGLARGEAEGFVNAARLRFEELAAAYQRPLADDLARFRAHIRQAHAAEKLQPILPTAQSLLLRPCAGGRLLQCLVSGGEHALRTAAKAGAMAWPVRIAAIDGNLYVLR